MYVTQLVSSEQQLDIEAAAIDFFSSVISCHAKNQLSFALILCDVIQTQRNVIPGLFLCLFFVSVHLLQCFLMLCINITYQLFLLH